MSIKIREATLDDAKGIAHVNVASWKKAYEGIIDQSFLDQGLDLEQRIKNWQNYLDGMYEKGKRTFVAINNGKTIGFIDIGPSRDSDRAGYTELYALYLDPNYYGQGIGKILFKAAIDILNQWGCKNLYVWVLDQNMRGRKFYERMGGVLASDEKTVMIDQKPYQEIQYRWSLNE